MLLGVIADDFTGASDVAGTLVKAGMSTSMFVGIPRGRAEPAAAGVVALKTRSIHAAEAVAQSLAACEWLLAQGCAQILFKYCSTFDSTPEGNIGPVAEALAGRLGARAAVVCPAFPANRRTVYQGHLFVGARPLNESGMENHPLNPMADADIVRWLRRQSEGEIGLVAHDVVRSGPSRIRAGLDREAAAGRRLVVVDALSDEDLVAIGRAAGADPLITGASGIAMGLPDNFRRAGADIGAGVPYAGRDGHGVALSGSCSAASRTQVEVYGRDHPALHVGPEMLMEGRIDAARAAAWTLERIERSPLIYTTASFEAVAAAQARYGAKPLAESVESFFGALAVALAKAGVVRFAIGGGETSGAIVSALKVAALRIGPEIDPGVPAMAEIGGGDLRLALKSGNFGAVDFYAKALATLGRGAR